MVLVPSRNESRKRTIRESQRDEAGQLVTDNKNRRSGGRKIDRDRPIKAKLKKKRR